MTIVEVPARHHGAQHVRGSAQAGRCRVSRRCATGRQHGGRPTRSRFRRRRTGCGSTRRRQGPAAVGVVYIPVRYIGDVARTVQRDN
jgi:hypothetical protein